MTQNYCPIPCKLLGYLMVLENNHTKYCMYIEPCRLAHGCIGWEYLLVVLDVIYKRKLKNIVYGNAMGLI